MSSFIHRKFSLQTTGSKFAFRKTCLLEHKAFAQFKLRKKKKIIYLKFSKFVLVFVSRCFDDVCVEVFRCERLDLVLQVGRRRLAHRLLLAEEDGGVTVDPVSHRLLTVVALVDDRIKFAEMEKDKLR